MPDQHTTERLLELAGFRGDAAMALLALHAYLAHDRPHTTLAMLYVLETDPDACRLAGLIAADGSELMRGQDAEPRAVRLPRFDDALARACVAQHAAHVVELEPGMREGTFGQTLRAPASIAVLPADPRQRHGYRMLLASGEPQHFERIDLGALSRQLSLAFALLAAGFNESIAARQHREIEGLADIQRLLQPDAPRIRGLDFAVHWQPAETAAGDYYDLMNLSHLFDDFEDRGVDAWGMTVGDVSGHGAAAAMEAVQFDAILRTYKGDEQPRGPAGAVTYANRYFFSRRQRPHFMTVCSVGARPDLGKIRFVNAGHLPLLRRRGGVIEWLGREDEAGIPLGILRDHRWSNVDSDLLAGDILLLHTDGIVEARDRSGRMFGTERLAELAAEGRDDPHEIVARIRDALFDHQDSDTGVDDQTLLVVRQEVVVRSYSSARDDGL